MIPQRISLLTIGTENVPVLRAFYQRLGWEETAISSDEYAVFKTAGVLLSLYPLKKIEEDAGIQFTAATGGYKPVTLAINVEEREMVDAVMLKIKQADAEILKEPYEAFWGGRIAYFADPEKNVWEVAYNPDSVFDERGAMLSF
ncbi:VOC family protein [Metabacillus sp. GX 13764]|uniref:VOC family protein n=1 Tax=Metabacillus kandeliae TaxID=2900151 RepID=UPI001E47F815|nr:VOC family protein [Metabacillus kandeliae]MCD7033573.1 VOC family protein [Metabacillus kandeliae]